MPGDYTDEEISRMSTTELVEARVLEWKKPHPAAGMNLGNSVPPPPVLTAPAARDDVWASSVQKGQEFVCPSGQRCLLRKIEPEKLMESGILDRVTRLEGLADELVQRAEGNPPKANNLPPMEDLQMLLETINILVPLAVEKPVLYRNDDAEAPEGAIRVRDVDLEDRMAIVNEALKGLRLLDAFRHA